ncbi:MAG: GDP-mannose 4,6 dehydratase [Chloroflexi bacterium]|nr:MAG: GDP-mannose 4,6 dehydratase [Chloroflexota bacterium]
MALSGKRVLITGISGFAGSYLARYLNDQNATVYGLVRRRADGSIPRNLIESNISRAVQLIEGDIRDISSIANALDKCQPDIIFHLASQSYVPRSFDNPMETIHVNGMGTANLLEVMRQKDCPAKIIFAGSSEEYGLVISSHQQFARIKGSYGPIFPEPSRMPELPINEENPLRPMSPYAVSKVFGDHLVSNYYRSYGTKAIISRAFNHEGAGRGIVFVTSQITMQVAKLKLREADKIVIGNVNAFRDWSHVLDICRGYCLLAEKGESGQVYNLGSQRTNSVLTYILLALDEAGMHVSRIESFSGEKRVDDPITVEKAEQFGVEFERTRVDRLMLEGRLEYTLDDKGIVAYTNKGPVPIEFDPTRFRPADVPILLSDTTKVRKLGFKIEHTLRDIIREQLNYFLDSRHRNVPQGSLS